MMLTLRLCLGASVLVLVLILGAGVLILVLRVAVLLTTLQNAASTDSGNSRTNCRHSTQASVSATEALPLARRR